MSLSSFLKGIADAIRSKKKHNNPINAQDFASEIESIVPVYETYNVTENGMYDIAEYKNVEVIVPQGDIIPLIERSMTGTYSIPYGVSKIGAYAFAKCNIKGFVLPETVIEIGDYAFSKVQTSVYSFELEIPETVTSIGQYAFESCRFKKLSFSNIELKNYAFSKCDIKELIIGENTIIGPHAFYQCMYDSGNLKLVVGEGSTISNNAFSSFHSLGEIVLPSSLEIIEASAFSGCCYLKKCEIKSNITAIGQQAFYNCGRLEEIEIPETVTVIGSMCFCNAGNSTSYGITLVFDGDTPPTLTSMSLDPNNTKIHKIYVPKGTRETYINASTYWSALANYIIEPWQVTLNVPSSILNDENFVYSLDLGKTWQQFTNSIFYIEDVSVIKFKSTDSSQTLLIGTSDASNDIGTIANAELSYNVTDNTTIYITISE